MANGWTSTGIEILAKMFVRQTGLPTSVFMVLVTKKNEKSLSSSPATDEGGGLVGIPVADHGYATNSYVKISGSVNYNGSFLVDASSSTNKVVIAATYVAETFSGSEAIHEQPGPNTVSLSEFTEIADGNGYTSGGMEVTLDDTGVPILVKTATRYYFRFQDCIWTADGGPIPASGDPARYMLMTAIVSSPYDPEVMAYWDLQSDRSVSDGQPIGPYAPELDLNWISAQPA